MAGGGWDGGRVGTETGPVCGRLKGVPGTT